MHASRHATEREDIEEQETRQAKDDRVNACHLRQGGREVNAVNAGRDGRSERRDTRRAIPYVCQQR